MCVSGDPRGGGPRGAAPCVGGGPRGGGPRGAALGGLWRGEYQLDDPSLLLLRTVSYQTLDASLPPLRAVSCQAAGGDGEPVVEAADSRGVYQRSSSRRAVAADLIVGLPLFLGYLSAVAVAAMPVMGATGWLAAWELLQATNGTYECTRSLFYAQSASVTSRSSADRAGRLQPAGATFPCARIMDCGESSSFAKTLECHSRMPSLSKSSARGGKNDLVQFRG